MATRAAAQPDHVPLDLQSTPGLLSRLFGDFTSLLRNEIALAKAELSDSTNRTKAGFAALIGAVATVLAGALVLVAALVLGLAAVMQPWLAAMIVGVVITVVGIVLLVRAKKKLLPPHVEIDRTRASVRSDVDVLARRT